MKRRVPLALILAVAALVAGNARPANAQFYRFFSGHVYSGNKPDTSSPRAGVQVELYGSQDAGDLGTLIAIDTTGADGSYMLTIWSEAYEYFRIRKAAGPGR